RRDRSRRHRGRQERRRSRGALFPAGRHAAAAEQQTATKGRGICASGRHARSGRGGADGDAFAAKPGGLKGRSAMESAIPKHLETARSRHRRVGDDYSPPYPSFVARHKPKITNVVMAYFGLQYRGAPPAAATRLLAGIAARFADGNGPSHWDRAQYVDQAGFSNVVSVAYWDDVVKFDAWFASAREAWTGQASDGVGRYIEVLRPSVTRYETLFSSPDR